MPKFVSESLRENRIFTLSPSIFLPDNRLISKGKNRSFASEETWQTLRLNQAITVNITGKETSRHYVLPNVAHVMCS